MVDFASVAHLNLALRLGKDAYIKIPPVAPSLSSVLMRSRSMLRRSSSSANALRSTSGGKDLGQALFERRIVGTPSPPTGLKLPDELMEEEPEDDLTMLEVGHGKWHQKPSGGKYSREGHPKYAETSASLHPPSHFSIHEFKLPKTSTKLPQNPS